MKAEAETEDDAALRVARIIIVDDHPIVRQGVAHAIGQEPDLRVCCGAANAEDALRAIHTCRHDLAIIDISLQGQSGFSLLDLLVRQEPNMPVLVMSMHEETLYAERVLRQGACGYIMKHEATTHLLDAIRKVIGGGIYLSTAMQATVLARVRANRREPGVADPAASLTHREFEVLRLIGLGSGTRQIAAELAKSVKTIEAHRANIKEKLGLNSATELVRFASLWVASAERRSCD